MAKGIAPIVSAVGGMPEVVRDNEDGLIVPPKNPIALSQAIFNLANNHSLRKQFAANAPGRIAHAFNIEATIANTLLVYEELLLQ